MHALLIQIKNTYIIILVLIFQTVQTIEFSVAMTVWLSGPLRLLEREINRLLT